jgi:hypothetical protein
MTEITLLRGLPFFPILRYVCELLIPEILFSAMRELPAFVKGDSALALARDAMVVEQLKLVQREMHSTNTVTYAQFLLP